MLTSEQLMIYYGPDTIRQLIIKLATFNDDSQKIAHIQQNFGTIGIDILAIIKSTKI